MLRTRSLLAALGAASLLVVACDHDPTQPAVNLSAACPTGPLDVGAPVSLGFNFAVAPSTVTTGNIVVTNAATGNEIPGALSTQGSGGTSTVVFRPSAPLPYSTAIRVRIQNVVAQGSNAPLSLVVCQFQTVAPPLVPAWQRITVSGAQFVGVSVPAADTAFIASAQGVGFRASSSGSVRVIYNSPYSALMNDVAFLNSQVGFASVISAQTLNASIVRTLNGGTSYDSIFGTGEDINRLRFARGSATPQFGLAVGGTGGDASVFKYLPGASTFTRTGHFTNTANMQDIDFLRDTSYAAAASYGYFIAGHFVPAFVHVSTDGGTTWTQLTNTTTDTVTQFYLGVAVRNNKDIWAVGGNGLVVHLTASGGAYTVQRVTMPGVTNQFAGNPNGLLFSDVEFAPDNDNVGWIIGAQLQQSSSGNAPTYQGLIFATSDGGQTWIRQGVRGAANAGADFPRLNHIDVLSSSAAWLVGDQGTVLKYAP